MYVVDVLLTPDLSVSWINVNTLYFWNSSISNSLSVVASACNRLKMRKKHRLQHVDSVHAHTLCNDYIKPSNTFSYFAKHVTK